jgi:hypothetical protein
MSRQLTLAQMAYKSDLAGIESRMIKSAESLLALPNGGRDENIPGGWSQTAFNYIFNDGIFFPLFNSGTPECKEFSDYISDQGNDGDECIYLADCWVLALAKTKRPEFFPIIEKLMDINVNGL